MSAGHVAGHPQRQVGLPALQRFQRARQGFSADLDAGRRAFRVEGFAQFEQRGPRDDGVDSEGELGLPAGGHPLDPLGHGIELLQQRLTCAQQFGAGGRELGAARAAVEQQHIERVFDLAHPVGQGAGHHAQLPCRRGHAAQAVHGFDQPQVFGREGGARCWFWTCWMPVKRSD